MVIRLAVIGAALVIAGLINTRWAKVEVPVGVAVLLVSGVLWLMRNRSSSKRR